MGPLRATLDWDGGTALDRAMFRGIPITRTGRWLDVPAGAQDRVHAEGMAALEDGLVDDPAFMALARAVAPDPDGEAAAVAGRCLWLLLEAWGAIHEPRWAPHRVALQLAAADLFGADPWLCPVDPAATSERLAVAGPADVALGRRLYAEGGAGLRAFLAQLYRVTQAWLASSGIERALVWRGMACSWPPGLTRGPVQLQPLSSWSVRSAVARGFAGPGPGVLLAAEVPASRIVATCRQGFGLLTSGLVVVMSGEGEAWALGFPAGADRMTTTEGALKRLAPAAISAS